jgi:hypothetical protein
VGALGQIDRLEDVEIEGVLDVPAGVARRQPDVHDYGILRVARVHLAERLTNDLLVLPDAGPRVATERRRFSGDDLDPGDPRLGGGRDDQ